MDLFGKRVYLEQKFRNFEKFEKSLQHTTFLCFTVCCGVPKGWYFFFLLNSEFAISGEYYLNLLNRNLQKDNRMKSSCCGFVKNICLKIQIK